MAHQRPRPQLRNEARMIIDFHTHTFPDPIADAAIDRLSRQANITAYTCGTAAGLLLAERAAGVDRSIILPVATKPEQVHHINDYAAAHNEHAFVTNMFPSAASTRITKTGSRSSTASPRPTCAASRATRPIRRPIWTTPNTCAFSSAPVRSVSSWSRTRAMASASPAVPAARRKRRAARCGRSVR